MTMKGKIPEQKLRQPPMPHQATELPPVSPRPGRRAFIERCEALRFREDRPTATSERDRLQARAAFDANRAEHLGNHLRIDRRSAPALAQVLERCAGRLNLTALPEVFIFAAPDHQAYCSSVGPNDVGLLALSGSLVELLDEDELSFVICHELGHLALHGAGSRRASNLLERVQVSSRSQAREISADRVGVVGCGNFDAAARALVKVHCGFRGIATKVDINAIVAQAADIEAKDNGWQATDSHPFLPLRLWALSEYDRAAPGPSNPGTGLNTALAEIDQAISRRLALMGGGTGAIEQAQVLALAELWLGALWLDAFALERRPSAESVFRNACGAAQANTAIEVLNGCGPEEITVRARSAVYAAMNADEAMGDKLLRFLDALSLKLGISVKATDAWVLLEEMREAAAN